MTPNVLNPKSTGTFRRWWIAAITLFLLIPALHAEAVATATLSSSTMAAGDSVQLVVSVEGALKLRRPTQIDAPGLEINFRTSSQQMQSTNGQSSFHSELIFTVEAQTPGSYIVPSIEITGDGKVLKTEPIALTVTPAPASGGQDQMLYAEVTVAKTKAYLGETIPVELKLYIDSRVRSQLEQMPTLEGDGFTKQKMPEPRQEQARRNGKDYVVVVFRTAITPSRAGKLIVGPGEVPIVAQVPQGRQNRSRSGWEELLRETLSDDIFAQSKRMVIKAPAVELDVKPLPAAGRPKDFSGAVGSFKFSATGTPRKVKVGDPITMKLTISGRGNFDRIMAPTIEKADGWHAYPPTSDFKIDNELETSGTKTFEMAIIPETKKSAMPVLRFSYFDPQDEKYVTLSSEASPLDVEEGTIAPPAPSTAAAIPETPRAVVQPADILGLNYDFGTPRSSFEPLYNRRGFLIAQALPATALLIFLASRLRRRDQSAARLSELRREKLLLLAKLKKERSRADFFEDAVRIIQMDASRVMGRPAHTIDAAAATIGRDLPADVADGIQEIFSTRAELLYAGVGHDISRETLQETEREKVVSILSQFEKSHGNS
ncbi:MAG: hypothetical protein JWL59_4485 [Chthoniobacteraceae bacterium]|nr:hypothetical protein [Chthoniobacteraceae bacterium]